MRSPLVSQSISSRFGPRILPNGQNKFHKGIDMRSPTGTPVFASSDGQVLKVEPKAADPRGRYVILKHGYLETHYYHLQSVEVAPGSVIKSGTRIGTVGSTGFSTGPHLHFEIREFGTPVDPGLYIPNM